jgi:hypothetical protein
MYSTRISNLPNEILYIIFEYLPVECYEIIFLSKRFRLLYERNNAIAFKILTNQRFEIPEYYTSYFIYKTLNINHKDLLKEYYTTQNRCMNSILLCYAIKINNFTLVKFININYKLIKYDRYCKYLAKTINCKKTIIAYVLEHTPIDKLSIDDLYSTYSIDIILNAIEHDNTMVFKLLLNDKRMERHISHILVHTIAYGYIKAIELLLVDVRFDPRVDPLAINNKSNSIL